MSEVVQEPVAEAPEGEPETPVEPETPEEESEESETPAEPETPETPAPGLSDAAREKAYAAIDRSFKTYQAAVERNLEEEVLDLIPCPLCFATNHPAFLNKGGMGRVPEEIVDNVRTFLGFARETDYDQDSQVGACPTCHGKGKTRTGSLVGDHMTRVCPNCKGYGYVPPPGGVPTQAPVQGLAVVPDPQAPSDIPEPDRDSWGEPRVLPDGTLNANYGKMPQFKSAHPVYGITANLSAQDLISG